MYFNIFEKPLIFCYRAYFCRHCTRLYIDALCSLTATGKARVCVNDMTGPEQNVVCGNGQGNPPSASTFNVGSDPLLRAANSASDTYGYTFLDGSKMPTTSFADDHLHGLEINSAQQIANILEVYSKYQEVSGVTVSLQKTSILGNNTAQGCYRRSQGLSEYRLSRN
jgi:hypothetical protein